MKADEIQSICIAGTEAYLKFLDDNKRGREEIPVIHKEQVGNQEKPVFKLTLGGRLFNPDSVSLELRPPNQTYGPDYFRILEYDGDAKVLIIQVLNPELDLNTTLAQNLLIISDLKFLVKNVKHWFARNGLNLELPQHSPNAHGVTFEDESQEFGAKLESCQREAVRTSLVNPLTYVWGPPGTGKTKHVLAQAKLQLILAQKRVGLFAPTNNALEQAMMSILDLAERAGIGKDKFLRVGHPSSKFAKDFPEVCEVQGLERRLADLRDQIGIYSTVLNHRRGATVLNSVATLRHDISELQNLLRERRMLYEKRAQLRRNPIHFFNGKLRAFDQERNNLERKINGQLEMVRLTKTESTRLNEIIQQIDFKNIEQIESDITHLEDETRLYMEVNRAIAESYGGQTNEEIQGLITDLEQEHKALEAQTVTERIKTAWVTGMTLDCFIGRFNDTFLPFDHIFLDEAGYAPLVKALTLCRRKVPLTFIGDHKQLGPVCEMDDENITVPDNNSAVMWKKSALFIDNYFLADDPNDLLSKLFEVKEPQLRLFNHARLNKTFRFGQNLADILSLCVYGPDTLVSAVINANLKITCLNAILQRQPVLKRQNQAEADEIASYLGEHPELYSDAEENFAILTPYKNQVALLRNILVQARRQDRILTIHKSQGREWDTVILSVVDGGFNPPWFTHTTNPQSGGLYVMNTAISRARKHLIIVCNRDYWLHPNRVQQLLSHLLRACS